METGKMIFPEALKTGDTVALVSPAFPIKAEDRDLCVSIFENMGYKVKMGTCLEQSMNFHNYLAGDEKSRAEDINRMFADKEVKAIFCVRGGYGSSHIMKYLDFEMIKQNPKIFVGFSDITNIHAGLQMFCHMVTFHGPMACSNMIKGFDDYSRDSLWKALNMEDELEFLNPVGEDIKTLKAGQAEGILTGGNLSLVTRACGTFFQLDTKGKILFLEDVEESLPALDMYITQMEYAGIFDGVKGILLGTFQDCTNDRYDESYGLEEFLKDRFSAYDVPIMYNIKSGHDKPMGTLPLGTVCRMDADKQKIKFHKDN